MYTHNFSLPRLLRFSQVYLQLRFGPEQSHSHLQAILETVDRVKAFSLKMRTFMRDVTTCGLQRQYESVCENIGLMAFVLQCEAGNGSTTSSGGSRGASTSPASTSSLTADL